MPTSPGRRGTNGSTVRVALLKIRSSTGSGRCMALVSSLLGRECHRDRGDRIAGPDRAHAVVRLRLDAHALRSEPKASPDRVPHRIQMRTQARLLRDDRRVERDDRVARLANLRPDPAQQLCAIRARVLRVVAREVRSEIAEAACSEDRVHHRMKEDVTIGHAYEPRRVLDRDAAQDQAATRRETMDIVTEPDALRRHQRIWSAGMPTTPFATSSRAYARSSFVVILRLRGSPRTIRTGAPAARTAAASSAKERSPAA